MKGDTMNAKVIGYWLTTGFLVFNAFSGGAAELARGAWKTIALLAPGFPRLKEWAYAGIFFNMSGAAISHVVSGNAAWHVFYTGLLAIVTVASWALRPQSRTLGVLFPTRTGARFSSRAALTR